MPGAGSGEEQGWQQEKDVAWHAGNTGGRRKILTDGGRGNNPASGEPPGYRRNILPSTPVATTPSNAQASSSMFWCRSAGSSARQR
jgi:hypothetical protein